MNRRGFLKSLFASTAAVVVAPEIALDILDEVNHQRKATYFIGGELVCTCGTALAPDVVVRIFYEYQRALLPPCPVHNPVLTVHDSIYVSVHRSSLPSLQNIPRQLTPEHVVQVEAVKAAMRMWGKVT